jgi:hypothetical protein
MKMDLMGCFSFLKNDCYYSCECSEQIYKPETLRGETMNNVPKKSRKQIAFDAIWESYLYPHFGKVGNTQRFTSQDIRDKQTLLLMMAIEDFVDEVIKLDELAFEFDKTWEGTTLTKRNSLGELFYQLLQKQKGCSLLQNIIPSTSCTVQGNLKFTELELWFKGHHYEISENFKALCRVIEEVGLNRVNFNCNPISIVNQGVLEGELINSLIIRLREPIKLKSFGTARDEQKKEAIQNFNKTKSYVERLCANHSTLCGIELVLYDQLKQENPINIAQSHTNFMAFLDYDKLNDGGLGTIDYPVGWWWKREYMSETNYYYKIILFFDMHKTNCPIKPIIDKYYSYWNTITNKKGYSNFILDYTINFAPLLTKLQGMLMRDTYLRLEHHKQFDHFGMEKLPKLIVTSPNNLPMQNC